MSNISEKVALVFNKVSTLCYDDCFSISQIGVSSILVLSNEDKKFSKEFMAFIFTFCRKFDLEFCVGYSELTQRPYIEIV